jgi:hypothetical protein
VPELGHAVETKNVNDDDLLTTLLARPDGRRRQAHNREIRPGKRRHSHDNPGFERHRLPSTSWRRQWGRKALQGKEAVASSASPPSPWGAREEGRGTEGADDGGRGRAKSPSPLTICRREYHSQQRELLRR